MNHINTLPDAPLEPPEAPELRCPICGSKSCTTIYYDTIKRIVGCDDCITKGKPEDEIFCFPDD